MGSLPKARERNGRGREKIKTTINKTYLWTSTDRESDDRKTVPPTMVAERGAPCNRQLVWL